jgi:hypothetical protein
VRKQTTQTPPLFLRRQFSRHEVCQDMKFAKTGSGLTQGKLNKNVDVLQAR